MSSCSLPYKKTNYFSKLIIDYLDQKKELDSFYRRFPDLLAFEAQIKEKQQFFKSKRRRLLSKRLMHQYGDISLSQSTLSNIDLLNEPNAFTITTGHQLNLFTGPIYYLYKIFSVINLCEQLKKTYPNQHFIPVFWMATEDHDFEEINHFYLKNEKISWNRSSHGAVGAMETESLAALTELLKDHFGESDYGKKLTALFKDAYSKNSSLAQATRYLANRLFYNHGLVVIDGNDVELKREFAPYVGKELTEKSSHRYISETTRRLVDAGYQEQVHPRELNLFYLKENLRERLVEKDGRFYVHNTDISFSKGEILDELEMHPERFSPNALLRPLYQEIILPNLCYIGGGGELAYWFQLKDYFDYLEVPFPILLLRNSVLLMDEKTEEKLKKHPIALEELFLSTEEIEKRYAQRISPLDIDFSKQKAFLQEQFKDLYKVAEKTDKSFIGAVAAQEKKQLNGLDRLEKRLLKAEKRKYRVQIDQAVALQKTLFPKDGLQERILNFSEKYLEYGDALLEELKNNLDPLKSDFLILTLKHFKDRRNSKE